MRKLSLAVLIYTSVFAVSAHADVIPKNVLDVKANFDKAGATQCSSAMAQILSFLAKGRPYSYTYQWYSKTPNESPISLDFIVSGNKDNYSSAGSIVFTPVKDTCVGSYTYSVTYPGPSCQTAMQNNGFVEPDWKQGMTGKNGDGGHYYYMKNTKNPALGFIFNDVAGGCSMTKRETLAKPAGD
jgi:hypothetical protein